MDGSDEWPDFRENLKKMGIEPCDEIIELLEDLSGRPRPIQVKYEIEENTKFDIFLDSIEDRINSIKDSNNRFLKKVLSKKNNRLRIIR